MNNLAKTLTHNKDTTVLFVEDNSSANTEYLNFLQSRFENLLLSSSTQDASRLLNHNDIDLVITELRSDNINGLELINIINNSTKKINTIILFNTMQDEFLQDSLRLNLDAYIEKSPNTDNFEKAINKVLDNNKCNLSLEINQNYLKQYQHVFEQNSIVSKTDTEGIITYVNEKFCSISGYTEDELLNKSHGIIKDPDNSKSIFQNIWFTINTQKRPWEGIIKNKAKDGTAYYIKTVISPIFDVHGSIIEYLSVSHNLHSSIDDKKHLFNQIEKNVLSILVLFQINEFDMLEKFYNISTIDQIEKTFTYNLPSYLPSKYNLCDVYFLSNGRFALLFDYDSFEKAGINLNQYLSDFIKNVKESRLQLDDMEFDLNITLSYSIGNYFLFEDAKAGLESALNKKTPLSFANDHSLVVAKEAKENLQVIKMVKIALDNYKIVSYFQPIINNKTREIEKYESLVRLIDEDGNIIAPQSFLNISKKGSYYNKITDRVLENSFKILDTVKTKISINISVLDIENEQTNKTIFRLLDEYKEDNNRIIFELLEDENIKDFKTLKEFIHEVKSRGVLIAIDDFGTGYSNFERLLEFAPNILKIDGSIIKNINKDTFNRGIVETIVAFAKSQNIETIAEYVENEEIFNLLNEIGVTYSQGYYFGKPKSLNASENKSNL